MQANTAPKRALVSLTLSGENHSQQKKTDKESTHASQPEVEACVDKAENDSLSDGSTT